MQGVWTGCLSRTLGSRAACLPKACCSPGTTAESCTSWSCQRTHRQAGRGFIPFRVTRRSAVNCKPHLRVPASLASTRNGSCVDSPLGGGCTSWVGWAPGAVALRNGGGMLNVKTTYGCLSVSRCQKVCIVCIWL